MKVFNVSSATLEEVVSQEIFSLIKLKNARIITFEGPLGAGKTTIIKILLKLFGVAGVTNSPTFGYVNSYTTATGERINHFDTYRLSTVGDFYQEALDELLYDNTAINFIEWPGIIEQLLQNNAVSEHRLAIKISYDLVEKDARIITCF